MTVASYRTRAITATHASPMRTRIDWSRTTAARSHRRRPGHAPCREGSRHRSRGVASGDAASGVTASGATGAEGAAAAVAPAAASIRAAAAIASPRTSDLSVTRRTTRSHPIPTRISSNPNLHTAPNPYQVLAATKPILRSPYYTVLLQSCLKAN